MVKEENHEELCGDNVINIQRESALRKQNKGEKQSGSLCSYFLSFKLLCKKKGVLSVIDTFLKT